MKGIPGKLLDQNEFFDDLILVSLGRYVVRVDPDRPAVMDEQDEIKKNTFGFNSVD